MMFNLVQEHNPSRRIYERAGFQTIGRIPHAHGEESGLIYWRLIEGQQQRQLRAQHDLDHG